VWRVPHPGFQSRTPKVRCATVFRSTATADSPVVPQAGDLIPSKIRYPLMKLVDMYFWQLGYEQGNPEADP